MKFSEYYKINKTTQDDWFDPILDMDTLLFIDPLLVYKYKNSLFLNSHSKIIDFFKGAFNIAATSTKDPKNLKYRMLLNMMVFPEVSEICLGYSSNNTSGLGSGNIFSKNIVKSIYDSIDIGLININHFESIGIFNGGIGRDRLSDATANIIKEELILYTQQVCKSHKIKLSNHYVKHTHYNKKISRWENTYVKLPTNPYYPNRGVILVPLNFLGLEPYINSKSFFDYCWDYKNQQVRDEFSLLIKSELKKETIIEIAKKHRNWVSEFEETFKRKNDIKPYPITEDPKGIYNPSIYTHNFLRGINISIYNSKTDWIENIITLFSKLIQKSLTDINFDNHYLETEESIRLIFKTLIKKICQHNSITIKGDDKIGKGNTIFKFPNKDSLSSYLNIKSARNSLFWKNIHSKKTNFKNNFDLYHVILIINDRKEENNIIGIIENIKLLSTKKGVSIEIHIMDTRIRSQGSNIVINNYIIQPKSIIKSKIIKHIESNNLSKAIIVMEESKYFSEKMRELIILKSRIYELKSEKIKGTIEYNTLQIEESKIKDNLLSLLEMIN